MDEDGAVLLLLLADDLVAGAGALQGLLVVLQLPAVGLQNGVPAQTAVLLLHEHQGLQDAGCFDTLHGYTSSAPIDGNDWKLNCRGDVRYNAVAPDADGTTLCNARSGGIIADFPWKFQTKNSEYFKISIGSSGSQLPDQLRLLLKKPVYNGLVNG